MTRWPVTGNPDADLVYLCSGKRGHLLGMLRYIAAGAALPEAQVAFVWI